MMIFHDFPTFFNQGFGPKSRPDQVAIIDMSITSVLGQVRRGPGVLVTSEDFFRDLWETSSPLVMKMLPTYTPEI